MRMEDSMESEQLLVSLRLKGETAQMNEGKLIEGISQVRKST